MLRDNHYPLFYPELQVLPQLSPPRFKYKRHFQSAGGKAPLRLVIKALYKCTTLLYFYFTSSASAPSTSNFVVLPYVRGVSERISRVLRKNGLKVGYKPLNVLRTCFPRPKDKRFALQYRGVVDKVGCVDCNFVYYGQTDRALETRLKEHTRALRVGDNNSKVVQHASQFVHCRQSS